MKFFKRIKKYLKKTNNKSKWVELEGQVDVKTGRSSTTYIRLNTGETKTVKSWFRPLFRYKANDEYLQAEYDRHKKFKSKKK